MQKDLKNILEVINTEAEKLALNPEGDVYTYNEYCEKLDSYFGKNLSNEEINTLLIDFENLSKVRSLSEIAREIDQNWPNVYFGARPYLNALYSLDKVTDSYGMDSADSITRYFLSNATTWRGETARRIKEELKRMLK
jgi:hypothetical protein